jgi:hypothetical protein
MNNFHHFCRFQSRQCCLNCYSNRVHLPYRSSVVPARLFLRVPSVWVLERHSCPVEPRLNVQVVGSRSAALRLYRYECSVSCKANRFPYAWHLIGRDARL